MVTITERVRQLAPHWAVMLVVLFTSFARLESVVGPPPLWQSLVIAAAIAFGYPIVTRRLGVAPEVWQRE